MDNKLKSFPVFAVPAPFHRSGTAGTVLNNSPFRAVLLTGIELQPAGTVERQKNASKPPGNKTHFFNKKPIGPRRGLDQLVRVHLLGVPFCPIISALAKLKAPHRGDHGKALECEYSNSRPIMTDRTPEQINHNIDQTLAICAETSRNLTRLEAAIEQTQQMVQDFIASAKPRLLSLETSREQDEERLEELENNRIRMERAHLEHQERMNSMERAHLEHQSRIDRQDRIIELLTRQIGTADPLD
jgi:hypothetical protein